MKPAPPAVPPGFPERVALFLDLDGTVLDLAPTPGGVSIPPGTLDAIGALADRLGGALAVISGRGLDDLDRILTPLRLPAAALDGAEAPPQRLTAALGAFVDARPGLALEDKGASVAVHYRATPGLGAEVAEHVGDLVERLAPDHELQPGKMVLEVRPRGCDKGAALKALMEQPPFAGRVPLVLGDDLTDEFAFEAAGAFGGSAILVGAPDRASTARFGLPDPAAARDWLKALSGAA